MNPYNISFVAFLRTFRFILYPLYDRLTSQCVANAKSCDINTDIESAAVLPGCSMALAVENVIGMPTLDGSNQWRACGKTQS
jgi:hypothetical protein